MISSTSSEPVPADLHNAYVAYTELTGGPGGGPSEVWLADTLATPPAFYNLSGYTSGAEGTPSIHGDLVAWDSDDGYVYEYDLTTLLTGGAAVQVKPGSRPSVWEGYVAFEDGAGNVAVYDHYTRTIVSSLNAASGHISYPSIGGNRVAYQVDTPNPSIAYRAISAPNTEIVINGPCTSHYRPQISDDGSFVIYTGSGCPSGDGAAPLYVTYLASGGAQRTYLTLHPKTGPFETLGKRLVGS